MSQLAVAIIIILFPGILTTILLDRIIVHSKWDSFKFSLYSLVLGVLIYCLLQLICLIPALWSTGYILNIWNFVINSNIAIKKINLFWEIFSASFLTIPMAVIISYLVHNKIVNKAAQQYKLSNKYGDETLYHYYLNSNELTWVYLRDFENDLTYQGKVVSFAENDRIQEIVLSDVTVYNYKDSKELYFVPLIYITKPVGKMVIERIPLNLLKEDKK